jgi:hypothetical protein
MSYIGPNELIYYDDENEGIHSGGFSVNSVMMKNKISPIKTVNKIGGGSTTSDNISDLFNDLVIPNWIYSHNALQKGGTREVNDDEDVEIIHEDIHDKLLGLMQDLTKNKVLKTKKQLLKKKRKTRKNN